MADLTVSGATDEGRSAFPDWEHVYWIEVVVTTIPDHARSVGSMEPRGLWQIGMVGLGNWPDDGSGQDPAQITWSEFVHFESVALFIPTWAIGVPYFHSVFWRFRAGVVADINVFWNTI